MQDLINLISDSDRFLVFWDIYDVFNISCYFVGSNLLSDELLICIYKNCDITVYSVVMLQMHLQIVQDQKEHILFERVLHCQK